MNLPILIQSEFKRRIFEESYDRIENCLNRLDENQIWHKPNDNTNSIGNLILHLTGNVRQYICSGLGEQKDIRERSIEFMSSSKCSRDDLDQKLIELRNDVMAVLPNIDKKALMREYEGQGFNEKGISIMIHVIEHFSYHVGQIALYTKLLTNQDLGFFEGIDLNIKSN